MPIDKKATVTTAVIAALAASSTVLAQSSEGEGEYRSGDFHNHTTCSDGSTSVRTLTREALARHDWFIHVGHSGRGPRDCRVNDFLYHAFGGGDRVGLWSHTIGPENIKGDPVTRDVTIRSYDENGQTGEVTQTVNDMWRWQSLQEFNLEGIVEEREFPGNDNKVAFMGLEWVVPGHEHASNSIITGQYDAQPRADALAQFEYCFARNSDDTSQGGGQGWTCEISEENNNKLKTLFANRPEEGVADYNSTLVNGINIEDTGDHVKSAAAILWMEEKFPGEGFFVQAHVERQGAFIEDDDEGWNVEHMRDANTLVPEAAIGFESQPGHQAQPNRGSYNAGRPTAGLWTYGGTGAYAAAEITRPGKDFDGKDLDPATFPGLGIPADMDPAKVVLSRPGIRTMWDALLSEGRRFWFFGSSDWHNRGAFGPLDFESSNDFWPGEYQDNYTYVIDNNPDNPAKDIVNALRSGNTYVVQGQLIDKLEFEACAGRECATMGETLTVRPGDRVRVTLNLRDPEGTNRSPYKFNNPVLSQIGTEQPLNQPELAHVDLITGRVFSQIDPASPEYYNPLAPESTVIAQQWNQSDLGRREDKRLSYNFRVEGDSYIRVRGSNIPPGTPNARDMDGNPLADNLKDNIPCSDPLCPPHIEGKLDMDVEAWSDIWFYSNPIFIKVAQQVAQQD